MATKKKGRKKLTAAELKRLAQRLAGTRTNVYQLAEQMFGLKVGDEVFEQLQADGLHRCAECNEWKDVSEMEPKLQNEICCSCRRAIDGEDGPEHDED